MRSVERKHLRDEAPDGSQPFAMRHAIACMDAARDLPRNFGRLDAESWLMMRAAASIQEKRSMVWSLDEARSTTVLS